MSGDELNEKWVPEVADREGVDIPDQEWVPENADTAGPPDQERAGVDGGGVARRSRR